MTSSSARADLRKYWLVSMTMDLMHQRADALRLSPAAVATAVKEWMASSSSPGEEKSALLVYKSVLFHIRVINRVFHLQQSGKQHKHPVTSLQPCDGRQPRLSRADTVFSRSMRNSAFLELFVPARWRRAATARKKGGWSGWTGDRAVAATGATADRCQASIKSLHQEKQHRGQQVAVGPH